MAYSNSIAFTGDAQRLLAAATTILMTHGFAVVYQDDHEIEFAGPGLKSTRQNPILGASTVIIRANHGRLSIEAEYGGVESLRRFMFRFPLLLGLGLGSAFAVMMTAMLVVIRLTGVRFDFGAPIVWWLPILALLPALLAVSPWVVLAPWIRHHLERKTTVAIETLMANLCHLATIA